MNVREYNLPGECREMQENIRESTGVGVKCQECRGMQGNAR